MAGQWVGSPCVSMCSTMPPTSPAEVVGNNLSTTVASRTSGIFVGWHLQVEGYVLQEGAGKLVGVAIPLAVDVECHAQHQGVLLLHRSKIVLLCVIEGGKAGEIGQRRRGEHLHLIV